MKGILFTPIQLNNIYKILIVLFLVTNPFNAIISQTTDWINGEVIQSPAVLENTSLTGAFCVFEPLHYNPNCGLMSAIESDKESIIDGQKVLETGTILWNYLCSSYKYSKSTTFKNSFDITESGLYKIEIRYDWELLNKVNRIGSGAISKSLINSCESVLAQCDNNYNYNINETTIDLTEDMVTELSPMAAGILLSILTGGSSELIKYGVTIGWDVFVTIAANSGPGNGFFGNEVITTELYCNKNSTLRVDFKTSSAQNISTGGAHVIVNNLIKKTYVKDIIITGPYPSNDPSIKINKASIDFGQSYINEEIDKSVTVENIFNQDIHIMTECPGFITTDDTDFILNAGESKEINFIFKPTEAKLYDSEIKFITGLQEKSIKVTGVGKTPCNGYDLRIEAFRPEPDNINLPGNSIEFYVDFDDIGTASQGYTAFFLIKGPEEYVYYDILTKPLDSHY